MLTALTTITTADGIALDGARYEAPQPASPRAGVLVIHGLNGNFYQGPSRWLPPRLAAMGYPCLAINLRDHDLKEPKDFDLAHRDVRAGVDALYARGAGTVVVLGHAYACNKIVRYPALSRDRRIRHWVLTTLGSVKRLRPEFWYAGLDLATQMAGHILVVQGAADESLEGTARVDELTAAVRDARVDAVYLEGADHYFTDRHAELAGCVGPWLAGVL